MIRVILADDHGVVRRGIRDFLAEAGDIDVVAEAGTGQEAVALINQFQPEVAILDIRMPNGTGIEITRQLRAEGHTLGILVLTAFDDPPYLRAAVEAGANGYVLKSSSAEEIVEAVRAVHEGHRAFTAARDVKLPDALHAAQSTTRLTEREAIILELVSHGLTNKAIGFQLGISDRTVQSHLANIYERLKVSNRAEAVIKATMFDLFRSIK